MNGFKPLDLNEDNVQAIFNRCLYSTDSKERSEARLFYTRLGYSEEEANPIYFDKDILIENKPNIEYLYGQLDSVHTGKYKTESQTIKDFIKSYTQKNWSQNKGILLELLYLASNVEVSILSPFNKADGDTTRIRPDIKETLSPKDPNFPEWWEKHKSEWEEPKKEGQEPADD
mgnify:CR=1 FL=1